MNNPEQVFNEIISLFNGALVKERDRITFGLNTIPDNNKFTRELTIVKGGIEIMIFKESMNMASLKETGAKIVTERLLQNAIKTIFLNGLDSFKAVSKTKDALIHEEVIDDLWDKHSEYIGEDIDSMSFVAGTVIMKKQNFKNALMPLTKK